MTSQGRSKVPMTCAAARVETFWIRSGPAGWASGRRKCEIAETTPMRTVLDEGRSRKPHPPHQCTPSYRGRPHVIEARAVP
jgi:hypothetical protein